MNITELAVQVWKDADEKGWHEGTVNVPEKLMMVVTELAEAVDDYRNGKPAKYYEGAKPCGFGIELADAVIRILDLAIHCGVDIESEIVEKMSYNRTRPWRHNGKKC